MSDWPATDGDHERLPEPPNARVFLDRARVCDWLSLHDVDDCVVGACVSVAWERIGDATMWIPQVVVYNYWPESRALAPEPIVELARRRELVAVEAARLLTKVLWGRVARGMDKKIGDQGFERADFFQRSLAPRFFVAVPSSGSVPERPRDFLEEPLLGTISELSKVVLRTDDPLSDDVSGGFLEGNLLTFRHEPDAKGAEEPTIDYMIVAWWRTRVVVESWGGPEEIEVVKVTRSLAQSDFALTAALEMLERGRGKAAGRLHLWERAIDEASHLASGLQRIAQGTPSRGQAETIAILSELRSALSRMAPHRLTVRDDARSRQRDWQRAQERAATRTRQLLAVRKLPHVRALTYELTRARHREIGAGLLDEVDRAQAVGEYAQQLSETLHGIEESYRRDEQIRQDFRQRRLTNVFGSLAILTAFPFLVGELNWYEWIGKLQSGQYSPALVGLYTFLDGVHAELLFFTTVTSVVLMLGVLLTLAGFPRTPQLRARRTPQVRRIQKGLQKAWEINRVAAASALAGRVGVPHAGSRNSELDELDREACEYIGAALHWLQETPRHVPSGVGRRTIDELAQRHVRLMIVLQLFDFAIDELVLPQAAGLLYVASRRVLADRHLPKPPPPLARTELTTALERGWGMLPAEAEEMAKICDGLMERDVPLAEILSSLGRRRAAPA